MVLHFLFISIIRFYVFGHLVIDENAIKPFPLTVKDNIEQLNLDEKLLLLLLLTFKVFNYINFCFPTRSCCCCYSLSIGIVVNVSCYENTFNICLTFLVFLDVSLVIKFKLTFEEICIWFISNSHKYCVTPYC